MSPKVQFTVANMLRAMAFAAAGIVGVKYCLAPGLVLQGQSLALIALLVFVLALFPYIVLTALFAKEHESSAPLVVMMLIALLFLFALSPAVVAG
jgi:hypothetical protein